MRKAAVNIVGHCYLTFAEAIKGQASEVSQNYEDCAGTRGRHNF